MGIYGFRDDHGRWVRVWWRPKMRTFVFSVRSRELRVIKGIQCLCNC